MTETVADQLTPAQNIEGHVFNALTVALGAEPWLPLSRRLEIARAVVAAVEPVIRGYATLPFLEASASFPEPFRTLVAEAAGRARASGEPAA